jgi:beta-carotene/zeaxanthin 4-ketolase
MGIILAAIIILLWFVHLAYSLLYFTIDFSSPFTYIHILLQTYFFTGLFITAHDAMHGTIAPSPKINKAIGTFASGLYACMSFKRLMKNHFLHHKFPGTDKDPDFSPDSQNFFIWWFQFIKKYSTLTQFICMAVLYNLLNIFIPEQNLIFLWVIPAVLSSFQLFFFGTYLPHKTPHTHEMQPHNARSQNKNFIAGLLSCYFFGFHFEHHHSPGTPWWKLYDLKDRD